MGALASPCYDAGRVLPDPAFSTPRGNRTPVSWLRTRYPGPLDDGGESPFWRARAALKLPKGLVVFNPITPHLRKPLSLVALIWEPPGGDDGREAQQAVDSKLVGKTSGVELERGLSGQRIPFQVLLIEAFQRL